MNDTPSAALADAYRRKAEALISADLPVEALETLGKALELELKRAPGSAAEICARRGELQENLGLREDAVASLNRAATLDPRSASMSRRIAKALGDLREYDLQAKALERAVVLEPGDLTARLDLARVRLWRLELPRAIALARAAAADAPDPATEAHARRILGAACSLAGRRAEARRELDASLRLAPGDAETWVWSAELRR